LLDGLHTISDARWIPEPNNRRHRVAHAGHLGIHIGAGGFIASCVASMSSGGQRDPGERRLDLSWPAAVGQRDPRGASGGYTSTQR